MSIAEIMLFQEAVRLYGVTEPMINLAEVENTSGPSNQRRKRRTQQDNWIPFEFTDSTFKILILLINENSQATIKLHF